jgi:hypothetical protein
MLALVTIASASAFAQTAQPSVSGTIAPQSTPSPTLSPTTPNPATDEVMAKRKLEESGYKDVRGLGVTPDGKITGTAVGNNGETKVEVDSTGAVGESR